MDIFEKLNKAFAGWYESLFGDSASDIRPKDVLRKIIGAMEDNRKEGLDNRIYVPNKYILEIVFDSDEEREYLLAFLEKQELESALKKYMTQNHYFTRGPLDFTLEEIKPSEEENDRTKLKVRCRWDTTTPEPDPVSFASPFVIPELADSGMRASEPAPIRSFEEEEEYTVAQTDMYDAGTVAPPSLQVKHPDGSTTRFLLTKPTTLIGRSRRLNNDLVIDWDGMVSKRHASISLGPDGFTVTDLDSTNGVWVNDEKVTKAVLHNGDILRIGASDMVFEEAGEKVPVAVPKAAMNIPRPRLVMAKPDGSNEEFRLPSETIIGRALSSDIRLENSSVGKHHARIFTQNGTDFSLEDLNSGRTWVNGMLLQPGSSIQLHPGDKILTGDVEVRFEVA